MIAFIKARIARFGADVAEQEYIAKTKGKKEAA
jgi:hypothetical protein